MRLTQSGMPCDIHLIKKGEALFFIHLPALSPFSEIEWKSLVYTRCIRTSAKVCTVKMTPLRCAQLCALSAQDPILPGSVHVIFCNFALGSASEDA